MKPRRSWSHDCHGESCTLSLSLCFIHSPALITNRSVEVEIGRLEREAKHLRETVLELQDRAAQVHTQTRQFVGALEQLDQAQRRIRQCAQTLQHAARVREVLASVDRLTFTADSLKSDDVVDKVEMLNSSLEVLSAFEEFANQRKVVDEFQSRLEDALVPRFTAALRGQRSEAEARDCIALFTKIGRAQRASREYVQLRTGDVRALWREAHTTPETDEAVTEAPAVHSGHVITRYIPQFYAKALELFEQEVC